MNKTIITIIIIILVGFGVYKLISINRVDKYKEVDSTSKIE